MDTANRKPPTSCHVVAVPYPGRGHVNPMMNLCNLIAAKKHDIRVTFVVTEEWLGFIGSNAKSSNIRFASMPNVIPSELVRGADFPGFYEAVMTKMEDPFEQLLDQLELPVTTIMVDTELRWALRIGNRRNIPVASLCTVPAAVFSVFHRFAQIGNLQRLVDLLVQGEELLDRFQGISSKDVADLLTVFRRDESRVMKLTLECISLVVSKAQYLLFNSVYELEPEIFDTLKEKCSFPIYPIGPAIPYFELQDNTSVTAGSNSPYYFQWLDSQPAGSVLYVSLGSFLSISVEQMNEIAVGLRNSDVRYFMVVRGETTLLKGSSGDKGMVVPWCDQLNVLSHSSVGGFWTHCGWNSTLEAIYAGVPMITFPIFFDQVPNSMRIVENWRVGWKIRKDGNTQNLVTRDEITELVRRFMDIENNEVKALRRRAKEIQVMCRQATAKGGSSDKNLDAFIRDIS